MEKRTEQSERRAHPRFALCLDAEIRELAEDHYITALTVDLSSGGACLRTQVVVRENHGLFLVIEAPPSLFLGTARVVALELDLAGGAVFLHLAFGHLTDPNRQRLEALLAGAA